MKTLIDGTEVPWETRTRNTNKGYILLTYPEIVEEDLRIKQGLKDDAERAKVQYKEGRRDAYPDVGEQLDEIMKWVASGDKDFTEGLESIAEECMAVKDLYPKPKINKEL